MSLFCCCWFAFCWSDPARSQLKSFLFLWTGIPATGIHTSLQEHIPTLSLGLKGAEYVALSTHCTVCAAIIKSLRTACYQILISFPRPVSTLYPPARCRSSMSWYNSIFFPCTKRRVLTYCTKCLWSIILWVGNRLGAT